LKLDPLRRRVMEILDEARPGDHASRVCDIFLMVMVLANVAAVVLESVPAIQAQYGQTLTDFETWSVVIFTAEFLARLWSSSERSPEGMPWAGRRRYLLSFHGLVDLAAILPFYLQVLVPGADLRILRVLRLLRVLKLSHYNSAIEDLLHAIWHERRTVFSALYLLLIAMLLCATAMYHAEGDLQPEKFSSIPAAMYWAMITLTTVGYGDVSPVSTAGQLISVITAFLGVCTVAVLTGVVASAFASQASRRKAEIELQVRAALADGTISADERDSIDRRRRQLNLSAAEIDALIDEAQQRDPPRP
jgi:voltage-gated potassium channel